MRELAAEVLCRVGLLPTEDAPYERQDKLPSLAEREKQGVARLGAFFERFAAMKKADSADPARYLPLLQKVSFKGVTGNVAFDASGDIREGGVALYQHQ